MHWFIYILFSGDTTHIESLYIIIYKQRTVPAGPDRTGPTMEHNQNQLKKLLTPLALEKACLVKQWLWVRSTRSLLSTAR